MLIEKFKKEGLALTKDAMRQVSGGYGQGCGWRNSSGTTVMCGISSTAAQNLASYGGYWCCTSCGMNGGSASYC